MAVVVARHRGHRAAHRLVCRWGKHRPDEQIPRHCHNLRGGCVHGMCANDSKAAKRWQPFSVPTKATENEGPTLVRLLNVPCCARLPARTLTADPLCLQRNARTFVPRSCRIHPDDHPAHRRPRCVAPLAPKHAHTAERTCSRTSHFQEGQGPATETVLASSCSRPGEARAESRAEASC